MVSEKLKRVIVDELQLDDWPIEDATTATSVPGWDSLNHARIIVAVEDAFGVRFRTGDVVRLENVGQLQALIDRLAKK
jgi:acyl carrier protein